MRMIRWQISLIANCLLMTWGFAGMYDRKFLCCRSTAARERAVSVGSNE